jgi:hypothetical protein
VREEEAKQQFLVESKAARPAPANLPIWLEYGTSKMSARSYFRPAAEAQADAYIRATERAVAHAAESVGL